MKRTFALLLCLCFFLGSFTLPSGAHSGGTDSKGGHINHSTGEYHYHHGQPAHQHPNGKCPYDTSSTGNSSSHSAGDIIGTIIACLIGIPFLLWVLWAILSPFIEKVKDHHSKENKFPTPTPQQTTRPINPPITPSQPKAATPFPQMKITPPTVPPKVHTLEPIQPLPHASGIIAEHPLILDADPDYLTEAQVLAYALSIETTRGKKAVTEQFWIKDEKTDKNHTPYHVSASVISINSCQEYTTTLVSCSCPDHRARCLPCKHMIALAIHVNAITLDTEALKRKTERS